GAPEQVVLLDTATGKELLRLGQPLGSACSHLAFSPDGKAVAAGEWESGKIHVWGAATGKEGAAWTAHARRQPFVRSVTDGAFAPAGKRLVTGGDDAAVRLWDAATGEEVRSFLGHAGCVFCVALSPDGQVLATGSAGRTVRLWDTATGKLLHALDGYEH